MIYNQIVTWTAFAVFAMFGLENPTFLAKSDNIVPKCTRGEESTGLGYIPKIYQFFLGGRMFIIVGGVMD